MVEGAPPAFVALAGGAETSVARNRSIALRQLLVEPPDGYVVVLLHDRTVQLVLGIAEPI